MIIEYKSIWDFGSSQCFEYFLDVIFCFDYDDLSTFFEMLDTILFLVSTITVHDKYANRFSSEQNQKVSKVGEI